MIQVKDVTKTYVSTATQQVDALKGVNFELGNNGLVCILGKSGSGKSTLLNLLGGIDRPTSGEIVVDGVSMNNFTNTDYDGYRNGYVGIIFQEFNLLADFNVKENVALALRLSRGDDIDSKVVDALRQVELSEKYLSRRVGELSGGEKQRIAIARCIVKNSQMILADEPTGNLDSATSASIWDILKRLSQTKTVVVVTHDRDSADKYADRVIEIADGNIISDNGASNTPTADVVPFALDVKRLPFRTCLSMGVNNLLHRKAKTAGVILLSIFSILALIITQMCLCFSSAATIARYVSDNDIPYITVAQQSKIETDDGYITTNSVIRPATLKYLSQHSDYIINGVVQSKQQLLDLGLTFVGESLEVTANCYYVTDDVFKQIVKEGRAYVEIDGQLTRVVEELHPIEYLIGKKVLLGYAFGDQSDVPTLAGIINSDSINEYVKEMTPPIFTSKDMASGNLSRVHLNSGGADVEIQLGNGNPTCKQQLSIGATVASPWADHVVLTTDGRLSNEQSITLQDNEVILSFSLFERLFEAESKYKYVNIANKQVVKLPEQLGQTFDFRVFDANSGDTIADFGEFKLVGIRFEIDPLAEERGPILGISVSKQAFVDIGFTLDPQASILVSVSNIGNLRHFLSELCGRRYMCTILQAGSVYFTDSTPSDDCATLTREFEGFIRNIIVLAGVICLIMLVVLVLLVINLISFSITARKREIGILSALGTSNKDITKIFVLETLAIATISFVIALILTLCFGVFANNWYCNNYVQLLHFFRVDVFIILTLAVATFGLFLLAAWIPIRKIHKLKPIDAIRNVK